MERKIRVSKMSALNIYWLIDVTNLDSLIGSELITIENFEELLKYRKNHKEEEWEFAEDFPEEEKKKLEDA